jgi:hypothetical protein
LHILRIPRLNSEQISINLTQIHLKFPAAAFAAALVTETTPVAASYV